VNRTSLALLCFVGVAAVVAGTASPALLAAGIGLLLVPGAAWVLLVSSARWVGLERSVVSCEVQEDAVVRVEFTVHAARWLPVHVEVEDHLGRWRAIERGRAHLELAVPRPGTYWLAPSRIRLRDATGTFERRLAAGRPEHLLVLPVPQCETIVRRSRLGLTDDPELQGLRSYVPGAPLAHIHWPALARGGELQVRHFAPPPCRLPLVVVDAAGSSRLEALDWLARIAAGHVLELARTGGCRVLFPGETTPTSVVGVGAAYRAVHRRLATLGTAVPGSQPRAAVPGGAVHLRATAAPAALPPAPPLPHGLQPAM
jgi:uncharacterized protein (DUF58 family)